MCIFFVPVGSPSFCDMKSKYNLTVFLFWVLWPLVSIRMIGYFSYKDTNYNTLKNLSLILNVQWNICYGLWTYINIYKLLLMQQNSPVRCTLSTNLLDINYELVIVFGIFPALTLSTFVLLAVLCSPCIFYALYRNRREEEE
jgi:hypothetical protein